MKGPPTFVWYPDKDTEGWILAAEFPPSPMSAPLVKLWQADGKFFWRHLRWAEELRCEDVSVEEAREAIIFTIQDDWRPLVPPVPPVPR